MASLSSIEFQLFKKYIHDQCGIDLNEDKAYLIETRLSKLLIDSGLSTFEALYQTLKNNRDPHIATRVIDAMTTNETLWFRDMSPWVIMVDKLLPRYIEELRAKKRSRVRIWSAAASTGQEAYSTVMCINDYLIKNRIDDIRLSDFEIVATDISQNVLEIARRGHYDNISIMRGLETTFRDRYFTKSGAVWELKEEIRNQVRFEQFNLQNSFLFLGRFDVVFCRYVLIYFSDVLKKDIFEKIVRVLNPEGTLIIGASELYVEMDRFFARQNYLNGTYYALKGDKI